MLINICVWLLEQLVKIDFEFLSVSYIISEFFLLSLCAMTQVADDSKTEEKILMDKCKEFDNYIIHLTPTEKKIYDMYIEDMTSAQILEELHITNNTLKFHNKNIYSKLNVNSRKQLVEIGKMHKSGEYKGIGAD
ncbi:MAG: helix-turn-helix transcriptional regulator [Lachnospiraceae bacterium]|nr:helix-turn-helix transcriptional regulator [Lachnospiraceae bacterium]